MADCSLECPVCGIPRETRAALMRHVSTAGEPSHKAFVRAQQFLALESWGAGLTSREASGRAGMWFGYDWIARFWRSTFGADQVGERYRKRLSRQIRAYHAAHPDFNHLSTYRKRNITGADNPFFGRTHSVETKARLSQIHKGKVISEAQKAKFRDKHHQRFPTREAYSEAIKARFADHPEAREKIRAARLKQRFSHRATKPERLIADVLRQLGVEADSQVPIGGVGIVDFRVGNVIVEVYGDYWHANPTMYGPGKRTYNAHQAQQVLKDKQRNARYAKLGYHVEVVWEGDILVQPEQVRSRLQTVLRSSIDETP